MHKKAPLLIVSMLIGLAGSLSAQPDSEYETGTEFLNLFFDFSGSDAPDYPTDEPTIGALLAQAEIASQSATAAPGPLILVIGSDSYIYDTRNQNLLGHIQYRADRTTGFYEMTAISHIGPAIAYLAEINQIGDPRWKERLTSILTHVKAVRAFNARTESHWLDQLNSPAWAAHKSDIRNMVDYACRKTEAYINSVGDGESFSPASVDAEFFSGVSDEFPIPFDNVMIGTFMAAALEGGLTTYGDFQDIEIDWSQAMVLIHSQAGTNVSSGLTKSTNWLAYYLKAVSGFELPDERVIIAPYADVRASLGQDPLPHEDFAYYANRVWGQLYYRGVIADRVFARIPTIYIPERAPLPGDGGHTAADNIGGFMMRLKHSLSDNKEMLSNTVGFWMSRELADKGWDPAAVDIPGLTTGFPEGVDGYPAVAATEGN